MAALREIAERLEDQSVGTVGTDVFAYQVPDKPDDLVAVLPAGGLEALRSMGPTDVAERPIFQLMSRATKAGTARDKLATAHAAIKNLLNTTLTDADGESARYLSIYALDEETSLGQDKNDRHRFSRRYQVKKEVSA